MSSWDLASVPAPERFAYWHDVICAAFVPLTPVRMDRERDFSGRVQTRPWGDLVLARLSSRAQRTEHGPREVSRTSERCYFVNLQLSGTCRVTVADRTEVVGPGRFTVVDAAQPYWFTFEGPWEMLSYRVPQTLLTSEDPHPLRTGASVGGQGLGALVPVIMRSLWQAGHDVAGSRSEDLRKTFTSAVVATVPRRALPLGRTELRAAVLLHVDHLLAGGDLTVPTVCRRFAISARTLHNAFADAGQSYTATVRERRLQRCAEQLRDPSVTATVGQVALTYGFEDASAFSRAFRRRFGCSPSEVRAQPCAQGPATVR